MTRTSPWPALATASTLSLAAIVLGWRGADFPSHVHRIDVFRDHGFVFWDNLWFGGFSTPHYGVLSPVLGSVFGAVLLAALCSVVSAFCADRLLHAQFGPAARVGSVWFAASMVTNLAVGRVAFALGLAFGLGALLALQRGHGWLAAALGALTALASPVAAVFLAFGVFAWASVARTRWKVGAAILVSAMAPLGAIALFYPSPGVFPFEWWLIALVLAICAAIWMVAPRHASTLRRAVVVYALASVAVFAIPNALGGNIARLAQYGGGPILASALWPARRALVVALAIPLLVWQWLPAGDGILHAGRERSTSRGFYTPLLDELHQLGGGPVRIEIPITQYRWESVYVGDTQPLARGWERQLDRSLDPIFYDGTLAADTYERWLADSGVTYVAVPHAPLDVDSEAEARLVDGGLAYLTAVWQTPDWQLWRFDASPGLVTGPATMTALDVDRATLTVTGPGDVLVRIRPSAHWAVAPSGCVAASDDGWIVLRDVPVGAVRLTQAWRGTPCSSRTAR